MRWSTSSPACGPRSRGSRRRPPDAELADAAIDDLADDLRALGVRARRPAPVRRGGARQLARGPVRDAARRPSSPVRDLRPCARRPRRRALERARAGGAAAPLAARRARRPELGDGERAADRRADPASPRRRRLPRRAARRARRDRPRAVPLAPSQSAVAARVADQIDAGGPARAGGAVRRRPGRPARGRRRGGAPARPRAPRRAGRRAAGGARAARRGCARARPR